MAGEGQFLRGQLKQALSGGVPYEGKALYIWGTGNTALLYQEGLGRLAGEGIGIAGYVDNSPKVRGGGIFCGKPVFPPGHLLAAERPYVLICTPQPQAILEISGQLDSMGIGHCHIDRFILGLHADEVLQCFDMMWDGPSREAYCRVIMARTQGRMPDAGLSCGSQYFALPAFGMRSGDEVFVDCGAYVGDTVEQFIWRRDGVFRKIIAFEPDRGNFGAAQKRLGRLAEEWGLDGGRLTIHPYGVGDADSMKHVRSYGENNGLGSKMTEGCVGGEDCRIVCIDNFIEEPFTFLKADIESYEYKMLLGAEKSIRKWKPKIAICIYHNAVDLYSVPLLIKSIVPEYKFACRHHSYALDETVLYAWIDKK